MRTETDKMSNGSALTQLIPKLEIYKHYIEKGTFCHNS